MKKLLLSILFFPMLVFAAGAELHLDKAPDVSHNQAALQNGGKLFINYCLNCHGLSFVRYNQLNKLGLSDELIKDNLLFSGEKVGDLMRVGLNAQDARKWFGVTPPDLSLVARARASEFGSGADWLYTYLRSFYRDPNRPTGWNNLIFENVGMPHVFWQQQGENELVLTKDSKGINHKSLKLSKPGSLTPSQYDKEVADLVGFLVWAGEPDIDLRKKVGIGILAFLSIMLVLTYLLKKEFWRDVAAKS